MRKATILLAVVLAAVGIVLGVNFTGLEEGDVWWPFAWFAWAPVGAVILFKRPGNGVGRIQLGIGLSWGLSLIGAAAAVNATSHSVRVWGEWLSVILAVIPWLGIIWLLLVFPSGRSQRTLEKVASFITALFGVLAVLSFSLSSTPMELTKTPSPLAVGRLDAVTAWIVSDSGFVVVVVLAVASLVALALRFRASAGVERHQYRWLLLGAFLFVSTLGVGQLMPESSSLLIIWIASGAAIPISIGIAILRYHLYDIDRIMSRTMTYALVIGLLGGAVGAAAGVVGTRFTEPLVVAATTLAVAALFNPLRKRIQGFVDRRFNRSRYDMERVASDFAASLRDQVHADAIGAGWVEVVVETMQPSGVGAWVKD